jgi:site-specific DNA-methyltransferase (adenine-specific)
MIIHGDCLEEMKRIEPNSISAIVTDPPYGLSFMGKGWDYAIPGIEYWHEAIRICRPGSYLLAMGGTRTFHRLSCAIEDSGFQIRDTIMWLYGSGFPKSHNHFGLEGFGTALKPAYEPIIMAMKPCDGTFKQNAEKWGQAGINIDGCRIGEEIRFNAPATAKKDTFNCSPGSGTDYLGKKVQGRWPANVILDEEAAEMLGEPSRFFYCAKASSSERNGGLDERIPEQTTDGCIRTNPESARKYQANSAPRKNPHPTVKPLKLMEYLIKLVMPSKDGILLDPFAGSGTTILAARKLGYTAIGIEKEQQYCEIARARIAQVETK